MSTRIPISPRYAMVSPTYIGFLVKRYGPRVTRVFDASPGVVVVRAMWNNTSPHPAMTAPTPNRAIPETETTCVVLTERYGRGRIVCCSPTPTKYPKTKTHGTGTFRRSRESVDSLTTVAAEVWLMLRESIARPLAFRDPIHFMGKQSRLWSLVVGAWLFRSLAIVSEQQLCR